MTQTLHQLMDFGRSLGQPADLPYEQAIDVLREMARLGESIVAKVPPSSDRGHALATPNGSEAGISSASGAQLRYQALVEHLPAVTFMAALDESFHDFYVSPQIESLLGFTQAEWQADPLLWHRRLHPDDRATWSDKFARTCATGVSFRSEYRLIARDGRVVWIHGECQVIADALGRPKYLLGVAFDITDRKLAEQRLQETNRALELAMDSERAAYDALKQAQVALNEMNQTLERRVNERTTELEAAHSRLIQVARQAGMAEVATGVLHNVGNVLTSVNVSVGLIQEKVKLSRVDRFERVCQVLEEQRADLGRFLSQDSRGVLIPDYLKKLAAHLMSEREGLAKELESLCTQVDHIKQLIGSQQSYAKGSGYREPTDVARLVNDAISMSQASLNRNGTAIERVVPQLPQFLLDRHKIMQILGNLISNSAKACKAANRPGVVRIVARWIEEERLELEVTDNGIGIPAENLTSIFSHGFTTRLDGHGFGLHSAANAAREMGGSLSAFSAGPCCGASFTLTVPAAVFQANPHIRAA
jgi:PAS domain S-box-containing protein